jgi:hypothetical protein
MGLVQFEHFCGLVAADSAVDGRTVPDTPFCRAVLADAAAHNDPTSSFTICPVCTKSTAVAIRAAIRLRVGQ